MITRREFIRSVALSNRGQIGGQHTQFPGCTWYNGDVGSSATSSATAGASDERLTSGSRRTDAAHPRNVMF